MGGFLPGAGWWQSYLFLAARTSTGAELRHLEESFLKKGGFSLKVQPRQGRSCPFHCQEGSRLLCPQPRSRAAS